MSQIFLSPFSFSLPCRTIPLEFFYLELALRIFFNNSDINGERRKNNNTAINLQPPHFTPSFFMVHPIISIFFSIARSWVVLELSKKRKIFFTFFYRHELFPQGCWWCASLLPIAPRFVGQMRSRISFIKRKKDEKIMKN